MTQLSHNCSIDWGRIAWDARQTRARKVPSDRALGFISPPRWKHSLGSPETIMFDSHRSRCELVVVRKTLWKEELHHSGTWGGIHPK
ncbi:hypothetical protein WG66_013741 [Moniliophthora roreri]|nr:hypothetical protein WG66_013741 [Moniliophthora roreri]